MSKFYLLFLLVLVSSLLFGANGKVKIGVSGSTKVGGSGKSKVAASIPIEVYSDNFSVPPYANNDDINVGNWTAETVYALNVFGGSCLSNNGANYAYYRSNSTFNASQYSTATITGANAGHALGVTVRQQTGSVDCYLLNVAVDTGVIRLVRVNGGTQTTIQTSGAVYTSGDKIWLEATGTGSATRLTAKQYTGGAWTTLWSSQDPGGTYIDGGAAGIAGLGSSGGPRLDDWSGGNL